jgi:hypothetical protein
MPFSIRHERRSSTTAMAGFAERTGVVMMSSTTACSVLCRCTMRRSESTSCRVGRPSSDSPFSRRSVCVRIHPRILVGDGENLDAIEAQNAARVRDHVSAQCATYRALPIGRHGQLLAARRSPWRLLSLRGLASCEPHAALLRTGSKVFGGTEGQQ